MKGYRLVEAKIAKGIWEGVLIAGSNEAGQHPPPLEALHREKPLAGLSIEAVADQPGHWLVKVPIPGEIISDGVESILLRDSQSGAILGSFAILAGNALGDDIRAEIGLLRAELDMLKQAFRRHCAQTSE